MTYNEFWSFGLNAYFIYALAYKQKQKNHIEEIETEAWFIGQYIMYANRIQPTMTYGMTDGKDIIKMCKQNPYPNQPLCYKNIEKTLEVKHNYKPPTDEETQEYNRKLNAIKLKAQSRNKN